MKMMHDSSLLCHSPSLSLSATIDRTVLSFKHALAFRELGLIDADSNSCGAVAHRLRHRAVVVQSDGTSSLVSAAAPSLT